MDIRLIDKAIFTILTLSLILSAINLITSLNYHIEAYAQPLNQNTTTADISLNNLVQNGSPVLGNISAPITIVDFSDFQCYLCNRYVTNTEPIINETYVQTGKVALVFKHLTIRGSDSMGAALAAQCTAEQGKFWQFHKLLYGNQKPIDSGWVSKENLKKFGVQIPGLDIQQFESCFESQKYKTFVQSDIDLALSFGLKETPSFIIANNDGSDPEFLSGALPFQSFKAVIDKKLDEKNQ